MNPATILRIAVITEVVLVPIYIVLMFIGDELLPPELIAIEEK